MAYVYAKPPVYCYQTFDRQSLQFTNHPVFQVYNPPPPDAPPPQDEKPDESVEPGNNSLEDGEVAAGDEGPAANGQFSSFRAPCCDC